MNRKSILVVSVILIIALIVVYFTRIRILSENNIKKNAFTIKKCISQYILLVERPKMIRYRQKVDTLAAGITNRSQPAALSDDACLFS